MEIKQQSSEKATTNTKIKNKSKAKNKLMNILKHNKNLLTVTEWLQYTRSKRA